MVRRKQTHAHANHERWLVSYADFITLLFAFFVVMFASSQVNKKKVARIAAYFEAYVEGRAHQQDFERPGEGAIDEEAAAQLGEQVGNMDQVQKAALKALSMGELAPVKGQLEQELVEEIADGQISLSLQARGLVLSLRESALFPSGRDTFTPQAVPILGKIGRALRNLPAQPVRLEGHTDNVPIETPQFPSNWELSAARAMAVLGFLAEKFEIQPHRLALAGYADYHPVADNETTDGRGQNRRVDIVVLSQSAAAMEPKQPKQKM